MDRFAFKIDNALKANLYKICRLCGIDNPEKVPILSDANTDGMLVVNVDEPELSEKILELVGFMIAKDDKMPQTICTLCLDKLDDFYEFREMCYATNAQTRKLLGLKSEEPQKILNIKREVETKRGRKRKSVEVNSKLDIKSESAEEVKKEATISAAQRKKLRMGEPLTTAQKKQLKSLEKILKLKEEVKDEPFDGVGTFGGTTAGLKLKHACSICDQSFVTKVKLDQHISRTHVPRIPRYVCTACNETIHKYSDIKNHQLWHKLSKTPYRCAMCTTPLASMHAFTRHLQKHWLVVPTSALLLDRECPQCHETFITNFLYNTHPCAVRTMICAGCSRQQRNEAEYLRHAALCPKVYLNHSRHLATTSTGAESCVRIKNENEVEAAADEVFARRSGLSTEMAPVMSMERLPSPFLLGMVNGVDVELSTGQEKDSQGLEETATVKGNKKACGVSRRELKRVDELLKSTLHVLGSIKHEPEVHVETDEQALPSDDDSTDCDTSHQDCDNGEDNEELNTFGASMLGVNIAALSIKQEVIDGAFKELYNASELNIKKEVIDASGVDDAGAYVEPTPSKVPVLKIKIKKEHGTLNSSIVDEERMKSERKKNKKKKRKEAEKERAREAGCVAASDGGENATISMLMQQNKVLIKQEPFDETNNLVQRSAEPEATVMTSIPLTQFQIAYISSGVQFCSVDDTHSATDEEELQDIKPNRLQLDRMLQITNVSSGVEMDAPDMADEDPPQLEIVTASGKALKSTEGGAPIMMNTSDELCIPIERVRSDSDVASAWLTVTSEAKEQDFVVNNAHIKEEPQNRGYSDELTVENMDVEHATPADLVLNNNGAMSDEQTYIAGINFAQVKIKQEANEEEIEVSEIQLSDTTPTVSVRPNGCEHSADEANSENDDDDEDDEEETFLQREEIAEKREYRELEEPPLLVEHVEELNPKCSVENSNTKTTANGLYEENNEQKPPPLASASLLLSKNNSIIAVKPIETIVKIGEGFCGKGCDETTLDKDSNGCVSCTLLSVKKNALNLPEEQPTTIVIRTIVSTKESSLTAQPFFETPSLDSTLRSDSNVDPRGALSDDAQESTEQEISQTEADEERQNLLNNSIQQTQSNNTAVSRCLPIQSLPPPTISAANCEEETENQINESADAALRQQQRLSRNDNETSLVINYPMSPALVHVHVDDNEDNSINEIAENNNNANIERELLEERSP